MNATDRPPEHLTAQELAAFLDRVLSKEERRRVAKHLNGCPQCRSELSRASAALIEHGGGRRTLVWLGPLAAAAVVAMLLLVPIGRILGPGGEAPRLRGAGDEGVAVFDAVSPDDGSAVPSGAVVFTWRSAAAGARYELTLTDARGDVLWSSATADTVLPLSTQVALAAGETYFWYVDALLDGARSAATDARRFTIEP